MYWLSFHLIYCYLDVFCSLAFISTMPRLQWKTIPEFLFFDVWKCCKDNSMSPCYIIPGFIVLNTLFWTTWLVDWVIYKITICNKVRTPACLARIFTNLMLHSYFQHSIDPLGLNSKGNVCTVCRQPSNRPVVATT